MRSGGIHIYIYIYIYIYIEREREREITISGCLGLVECLTKVKEHSLPNYLPIVGVGIIGFILFPQVFVLCEMQSTSFRIWTRVIVSISYNAHDHITNAFVYQTAYIYLWRTCICLHSSQIFSIFKFSYTTSLLRYNFSFLLWSVFYRLHHFEFKNSCRLVFTSFMTTSYTPFSSRLWKMLKY